MTPTAEFDGENRLVLDFDAILDSMPEKTARHLALLLANRRYVLLYCAQLISEGMTFDEQGRFYYPAANEMQEARLYLMDRFGDVQRLAVERAQESERQAKEQCARAERRFRSLREALLDTVGQDTANLVSARWSELQQAKEDSE